MRQLEYSDKKIVFERDNYTCRYCGSKDGPFHVDHVYPHSKGGETSIDNSVTACADCNRKKQARVGLWPKPIGYFEKKPNDRRWIFSVVLVMVGISLTAWLHDPLWVSFFFVGGLANLLVYWLGD